LISEKAWIYSTWVVETTIASPALAVGAGRVLVAVGAVVETAVVAWLVGSTVFVAIG
jgi:hypothetical protein